MTDYARDADWDDVPEERSYKRKEFLSFADGERKVIRILDKWLAVKQHFVPGKGEGAGSFTCIGEGCPLCDAGDQPRDLRFMNVYDYEDGLVKIWKAPPTAAAELRETKEDYGSPLEYDVIVKRAGNGYTVKKAPESQEVPQGLECYDLRNAINYRTTESLKEGSFEVGDLTEPIDV